MRFRLFLAPWLRLALVITVFLAASPIKAESILGGLEELSHALNRLNDEILDRHESFNERMRLYRLREEARVREMSIATGVSENLIRNMRRDGATWGQIAAKYGVNLYDLPQPPAQGY